MQLNHFFIILFFFPFLLFSQSNAPFIEITHSQGRDDILVDCDYPVDADRCFVLEADYTEINKTTSYAVSSIPFVTLSGLTNETLVSISEDDTWSGVLQLPFDFCYYDQDYSDLIIGDNGLISFNTALANADSPYSAATIPNGQMPTSAIFGAFHDMTNDTNVFGCTDDPATPENECGEIKTYTIGTAPQRAFVVSYENLNHFNCEESRSTTQIVLYETSNVIEVYIAEKPINCETDVLNSGVIARKNALIGIQNMDASAAVTPPDRNTSVWSATNEAWRFTPNGLSASVVEWTDENGDFVATGDQIIVCPEETTSYTATVTYDMCVGDDIVLEDTINIAIDFSYPIAIDNEVIACDIDTNGEELIDLTTYEPLMVGTQTGLVLSYYNSLANAQAGTPSITDPTAYLLTNLTEVFYVRLQRSVGCFDVGTLTINLRELVTPQLTELVLCDTGNDNSEQVVFSNYTSQILGGQTGINVLYYATQADADNNQNPITSLTAANGVSFFVSLSLQPNSTCPNVVEIPIVLLPTPVVEPIPVTLCSDILVYDLTQHEPDVQANNTETLRFSYHLRRSWALNNIRPFDPTDANNPIDPENYTLNGISQIWVRAVNDSGCVEVFPINFTYIDGVIVQNAIQVSTGNIFDLTSSINDMVTDLTGITVQYYYTLEGAQAQDPNDVIADPENFAITNPDEQVFVVFINTASGCISIGTINLETVGFGGNANSDFQICDADNDLQETITLSDYNAGLIADFEDAERMVVSYHNSQVDATNNVNEITEITITAPTTIYARVSLVFGGAELSFMIFQIQLDFQSTIPLNPVTDTICDEFGNNREVHDITQYEDQISTTTGASFEYQYTNGATINDPTMTNIVGPTRVINVLVTTPDGCTTETTITINFHPLIATTNTTIQVCDADGNNEELFNLDDALPNINPDHTNYEVSYHSNLDDAQNGDSPITNPNAYLVTANTSVFVRLYNATTTCYSTAEIDLEMVSVPEIVSDTMTLCDFENDGIENNVDLTQFNSTILGTQTGVTLTYYNTEADANAQTNPIITKNIANDTEEVFVNLSAPDSCILVGSITINLQASPVVNDIDVEVCDNFMDSEETYNLTLSNSDIIADTANHSFRYYRSKENAMNNTGAISSNYLLTSVPQTLYVRVTSNITGCFSIAEMRLDFTFPAEIQDTELIECDNDFNLSEEFDLTSAIPNMIADATGLDITYYSNETAAVTANAFFLIATPESHNTASETDNVYVRFYDPARGCFSTGKIILKIFKTPKLISGRFEVCDTDFDGFYTLDLANLNPLIIQDQTDLVFDYYTSFPDAETETNPISNTSNYAIPNDNHNVYIRVTNASGCWAVATVIITIKESVAVETITDALEVCDNDLDGFSFFDLTTFENLFTTETGATFRYYNNQQDANLQQNEITNPTVHQNANPNTQTIFVRVSVSDKCDSITSFVISTINITPPTLTEATFCVGASVVLDPGDQYETYSWSTTETTQTIEVSTVGTYSVTLTDSNGCTGTFNIDVSELPLPQVVPTNITECDYDGAVDGLMQFNLNDYNSQLTGNNPNVTTHFFISQTDLDTDTNEQNTLFTNTTNPQTLYVKVVDNVTGCFDSTELTLNSSFVELTSSTYEICDTDFDGNYTFHLTELNPLVVTNITDLTFEYYTSQVDAETQNNPIAGDYTIPNNNHDIFVRVENSLGCAYITTVSVSHREDATVNVVTDTLEVCDNNSDGFSLFDLTTFENLFTTETGATFRYYNTEADANLQDNEITNPTAHQNTTPNTQTVYVRVSVSDKCDAITSFVISTINITPPIVTEATFCAGTSVVLDPGDQYETYSWSTGETTQTIEVSVAGTYSVTLTDSNGCSGTFPIEVIELPLPESFDTSILECDYYEDADGFMQFNLANYNSQLTGNNPNVTTHFFISPQDLEENMNEQNTLFTNTSNPQILYVKVVDNTTGCFSTAELTLEASFIDPNPAMLELCDELNSEDGLNTFDLSLANAQVTDGLPINTNVTYYETYSNAELQQNPLNTTYYNIIPYSQTIYSRVENTDGCFGIDEVLLIVNDLPDVENEEVVYCLNTYPDTLELESGVTGNPNHYTYNWSTGETTPTIQINEIGVYTVTIISADGCGKSREITVVPSSTATIERVDIEDPIAINIATVYVSGEGDYEYALDDENGPYQDENIFTNVSGGLHTVYVRDKNGCGIVSKRISAITVPNFFTPNNDGYNDYWIPKGFDTEFQSNVSIYVFDRYGKLLKKINPLTSVGWDGIYNNNLMPQNDYWYSIEFLENFSGRQRVLKGHFALIQ